MKRKFQRVGCDAKETAQFTACPQADRQEREDSISVSGKYQRKGSHDIYHFDGNKPICYSKNAAMTFC
jgi:hypothetical protein